MKKAALLLSVLFSAAQLYGQAPLPSGTAAPPSSASGARAPRYIAPAPYDFNEHDGWTSLFDGKTLKGWEGPTDEWRVENGSIVSASSAEHPQGSAYLTWAGGDVKDFEFKTEIKLEGQGANSGVQFRAQMLGKTEKKNSEWESFGYQADWDYVNEQTGALIECCAGPRRGPSPRPFKASMGQVVIEGVSDPDKPMLIASFGDPQELKNSIHTGEWNQLHIIAHGNTMMYILNGKLMSVFIDDNPKRFIEKGRLQLQLEGRGDTKVSFRDIWLKQFP
jgi:hypothetical protein